jgi:hypothetical protein
MNPEERLFSWGAPDNYESLPLKFIDFFKNITLDYDWYFLIDDDTYVYTDRLKDLLSTYSTTDSLSIGYILNHLEATEWGLYHSGGGGTVVSRALYDKLCHFVRTSPWPMVHRHWCADICLGLWIKAVSGELLHHPTFHHENYNPSTDDCSTAVTFHHLKTWSDFERLYSEKN